MIPRCAGSGPSGGWATCGDIKLLNPIQSKVPQFRIIYRGNTELSEAVKGEAVRSISRTVKAF